MFPQIKGLYSIQTRFNFSAALTPTVLHLSLVTPGFPWVENNIAQEPNNLGFPPVPPLPVGYWRQLTINSGGLARIVDPGSEPIYNFIDTTNTQFSVTLQTFNTQVTITLLEEE